MSLGMITADSWRILSSALGLRQYLLDRTNVRALGLLPERVFEDASVQAVVVILQREADTRIRLQNTVIGIDLLARTVVGRYEQKEYATSESKVFWVFSKPLHDLRSKVDAKSVRLMDLADVDFGLKTADDKTYLKASRTTDEDRQLVSSKCIGRYTIEWDGSYVWYVPEDMKRRHSTARPGEPSRFEDAKVIVSRMAERLSACVDLDGFFVKDALLVHANARYQLHFIASLVNSRLLDMHYGLVYTTVDLHRNELLRLPIRRIAFTTPDAERQRLGQEAQRLYAAYRDQDSRSLGDSGSLSAPLLAFAEARLAAQPEQSDVVHDLLAFLAEQMIDLNKQKQHEVKGFLAWLESYSGGKIDDLPGKTTIQNYLGDYQKNEPPKSADDLLAVLRKNVRKLGKGVDPAGRPFTEKLTTEYAASLAKLLPLKQRLAATDWLIDQIVYKLYGLTEDEIVIVEGR